MALLQCYLNFFPASTLKFSRHELLFFLTALIDISAVSKAHTGGQHGR